MYIILNTADFSANNIGTLDQWSISCNRPKGITWSGLTSAVDKGANFSAVAEIDTANYELITMSVTMGATTQSGVGTSGGITISKSGSRYTITISSVTANVNIRVTTKNLSTETPGSGGSDPDIPGTGDGELIKGLYTAKDFYLKTGTDSTGAAITVPVMSDTNNARVFVCGLEDGATYTYSYSNGGEASTYRTIIATFAPTMDNIKIAPLGNAVSGINASTVSSAVKVIREQPKQSEGSYSGTFTNTENAKTLIMFVGWGSSNITASVKKIS